MRTSLLSALLTTTLPFASLSSPTPPQTPRPIANLTNVTQLPPPFLNSWAPPHTWPPTPFTITIPDQTPPAFLHFLQLLRPGRRAETNALLSAISLQIAYYDSTAGLPGPFTIVNANVRFCLRLASPTRGGDWLSKELAVGALRVFGEAVRAAGAREGCFVVVAGEGIKGTVWVKFVDAVPPEEMDLMSGSLRFG